MQQQLEHFHFHRFYKLFRQLLAYQSRKNGMPLNMRSAFQNMKCNYMKCGLRLCPKGTRDTYGETMRDRNAVMQGSKTPKIQWLLDCLTKNPSMTPSSNLSFSSLSKDTETLSITVIFWNCSRFMKTPLLKSVKLKRGKAKKTPFYSKYAKKSAFDMFYHEYKTNIDFP